VGYEITDSLSEPYSQATAALPSYFPPSAVGIAGVPYLLDTASDLYRRVGFDVVQQRNTTDQRDVLLLPQDVWRQQAQSWHFGAGQSNVDRDDTLPYRYNTSYGVDPWTEWRLSLLPQTSLLGGTSSLAGTTWVTTYEDKLAVVNDQSIYWYDSLSASASLSSTTISSGNAVIDVAHNSGPVTALTVDRYVWYVEGPGATPTKWANHQYSTSVTFVDWAKDYLIVGDGNSLYNALKGNNPTTIYTHPETDFRWYSATGGQSQIYVLGRVNDRTIIHRVGIKQDGTGLIPCIVAAQLPDGEIGYQIQAYLGFVLIGTNKGVRVAVADSNGDLTLGSIIPTTTPVRCFEGQDRFAWFGNEAVDGAYSTLLETDIFPTGTVVGLSRLDLSRTTVNQLTPAYASDIVAETVTSAQVISVITFSDKRVFSLNNGDVWVETSTLMPGGWLKQGVVSYGVEDVKTGLYMQAKWEPLTGEIDLDVSYDSTSYVRVQDFKTQSSIRSGNISTNGVQFSRMEPRYVLKRLASDTTLGPILTRWELRSIPVKGRNSRWTLPIQIRTDMDLNGVHMTRDPLATLDTLIGLVQNGNIFILQESGQAYTVHGKDFEWRPEKIAENGRAWEGVLILVLEEVA